MTAEDAAWLDREYNPLLAVPDPAALFADWNRRSAATRETNLHFSDIPYGPSAGQVLDVFPSTRPDTPVLVFIHGGFWRGSDKSAHSFLAPAFTSRGATVVLLNYDLCPAVRIETILAQVSHGVAWVYRHIRAYGGDPQRITLAGHSAGAHLTAMLLARDGTSERGGLPPCTASRALCISGLFDLDTVRHVPFLQPDLALTRESARMLSPVAHTPRDGISVHAVVGELESSEFHRQNTLLGAHWGTSAVPVTEAIAGRRHFDILDDLSDPSTRLHGLARQLLLCEREGADRPPADLSTSDR
ncbi:alpha/beta hydrolase [Variovorax sp. M-6]|uniref:alpha/beta hydrolase n=1 Tax=Variovorax sp. M-6 TaxID=3233041 RepID=UPI003F950257